MGKKINNENGYTIVELAVALVIILIVLSVVVVGVGNIHRSDLSTTAMNLSSAIKYLYSLSVLNNRNYRLVMDIENGSYWGEELKTRDECNKFLLPSKEEEKYKTTPKSQKNVAQGFSPDKKKGDETPEGEEDTFQVFKDNLLSKRELPRKIHFDRIMTSHSSEPFKEGRAEIHFWSSGYVEKAYIYLGYEDELYTIETVPLMGIAHIHSEELEISDFYAE